MSSADANPLVTPGDRRSARADTDAADTRFLAEELSPWLSPAYGAANVVMQLANSGVAYGVMESKVDSGNLHKHPFKRARTTFTYIAVAIGGNAHDRKVYREAVNAVHAQVRSGAQSPVRYNAFDPQLQLWVAACMAAVFEDTRRLRGGRSRRDPEAVHRAASMFATMLQVPQEMWPGDRAAADRYWQEQLDRLDFDDRMRTFLVGIARLDFLPAPVPRLLGGWNLFMTLGYLPAQLRDKLGFEWSDAQQRRFDRWQRGLSVLDMFTPRFLMRLGVRAVVWDMRLRHKLGATVV
ncbi:oxygenase MpaB family protein [Mycobacterium sp. 94-17]|uniref:oxygenase MpaB family protein n=1 Tax=Mycobacterium sp. 94-17 TaxID=2986147 RepID=UPI002D1F5151|nr:oxygenase MpaB family protein [Mycobacterium sp. 94-17]MEB4209990.1 oxygenase MpaB family protein [Mycobacterium sp. 94-17]